MNIKKNFVIAFALGAIVFAFSTAAFGQTQPPRGQYVLYGMHFINSGQTKSIIAINSQIGDPNDNNVNVLVVFDIYEAAGNGSVRLRFVRRVSREVLLASGEAATFEFPASRGGNYVSTSLFARPGEIEPPDNRPIRLVSTLTVRQFGVTILNLPAVLKGFDPQPDPPAARPQ